LLPDRLTGIDDSNRGSHHFLEVDDRCLFFGEFFSSKGYSGGHTNQLITNYKRTPLEIANSAKAQQLQYYKDRAINEIAEGLRKQFDQASVARRLTFVPLPSSKIIGDPEYCDRLEKTLRRAFGRYAGVDIRLLLRQTKSTTADHRSGGDRIKYEDLLAITEIDHAQLKTPVREEIVLFDDVLTSGKHYKVAKTRIHDVLPGQSILGVCVARAIHPNPRDDFEDLTEL
jgi:hypothetical protein